VRCIVLYCIVLYYTAGNVPYVSTSDVTNRRRGDESLGLKVSEKYSFEMSFKSSSG
jgi:hypothetical protein